MSKSKNFFLRLAVFSIITGSFLPSAQSADVKWTGSYRAEGVFLKNFTLDKGAGLEDSYIIHHLVMEPEIIPSDGLKIKSRFDIFNNALATSTAGQAFGQYSGPTPVTGGGTQPPAVFSNTQQPQTINVNALYMEWINEFSALTIGRVPFHYGLGMTYSNGEGAFDHSLTNKDMVAYKIVLGNLTFMPAYGKVREGFFLNEDDINDYMVVAEYNNSESDLSMGFLFDQRVAPQDGRSPVQGNDAPLTYFSGNAAVNPKFGAAQYDPGGAGYSAYNMNFFVQKKSDTFSFGAEVGFVSGYSGVQVLNTTSGAFERVNLSGFGVSTELGYKTGELNLKLYAGMASGDDPDTSTFEGYGFNPNYQIAMIMFAFPVGANGYDPLRSTIFGSRANANSTDPAAQAQQGLNTEVISNAIYVAPQINWAMGERYDFIGTFAFATQAKPAYSSSLGGTASQIGFEADLGFRYHPSKNFQWLTTLGGFFPGGAYNGQPGYSVSAAYGAISKAAINF